jgi:hypothetical protein
MWLQESIFFSVPLTDILEEDLVQPISNQIAVSLNLVVTKHWLKKKKIDSILSSLNPYIVEPPFLSRAQKSAKKIGSSCIHCSNQLV